MIQILYYDRYRPAQTVIAPGYASGAAYSASGHLLGSNAGNYGLTSAAYPSAAYVSGGSGILATGGKVFTQGVVASSYPSVGAYVSGPNAHTYSVNPYASSAGVFGSAGKLVTSGGIYGSNGYAGHGSLLSANSGLR